MVDVDRAPEPDDLRAQFINDQWTRTRRATQPADNAHDLAGAITANLRLKGDTTMLDLERAWIVACSRCANEGISNMEDEELAHLDLRDRGWTRTTGQASQRTFCPECSKETSR